MLLVSDLLGLEDKPALVSPPVLALASFFDGKKRAREVQAELAKENATLSESEIQDVADQLDKLGLLETAAANETRARALEEFRNSPVRKQPFRGLPDNPLDMAALLNGFSSAPKGPGDWPNGNPSGKPPLGLLCPHIDFARGGPLYAWSYRELARRPPPDVIVALGVAHLPPNSPWAFTRKAYETPFGPLPVAEDLYRDITESLWYDPVVDEWAHAKEHSLEFQALWLKHLWREKTPKWVPLLCSSYERYCVNAPPSSVPTVENAIQRIGDVLAARAKKGQSVLVLAGVDLSHVGRRFGDGMEITDELKKKIESFDRQSLEKALALDADGFFLQGTGENAWRKVCGLSAIYTSLRWIKSLAGGARVKSSLLAYDMAPDPAGGEVSFASAVFET